MNIDRVNNPIARVSAILAAVFFVLASVILATFEARVIHSEIVFLSMPVTFGMGLISWLLGLRGLRAAKKQPSGMGRKESLAGCLGGLATALLAVVTFLSWGGSFRQ